MMDRRQIAFAPVAGGVKRSHDLVRSDGESFRDHYAFYRSRHGRLCGLYAVQEDEGMELRVLLSPSRAHLVSLVRPLEDSYPSLSVQHPEASWFERALAEREGILPEGHPDLRPIRLRDQGGGWLSPLPGRRTDYFLPCQQDGHMQVSVGPVHAGVIGSGHFRFHVQGEQVEAMQTMLGYCHRGMEDMLTAAEGPQALRLVERISGDNGVAHALAYSQALEADRELPLRARCIRSLLAELERIACHLGTIGGIALDVAFVLPSQRLFALKESIHRLMWSITGHRYGWGAVVPGGVARDLNPRKAGTLEMSMISLGLELDSIARVLSDSASFIDRVETTGRVGKDEAEGLMLVGPVARASGVPYDVRENMPYSIYGEVGLRIPYMRGGDVLARMEQRIEEVKESTSIVMQALELIPAGDLRVELDLPTEHDGVGMVESPRGELVHAVHIRGGRVRRHMVKDPSFHNWRALELASIGNIVPDFPVINKSFDLSYSGNDL